MFEHNQIFLVVTRQSVCQHMLMEPSWKFDQLTVLEESATSETTTVVHRTTSSSYIISQTALAFMSGAETQFLTKLQNEKGVWECFL